MSKVLEWLNGAAIVRDMTAEEITERDAVAAAAMLAKRLARRCTRYQLKAALVDAGLWPQVQAWLTTATARQKLALAEAPEFRRDSPAIVAMAAGSGLTDAQMDAVFSAAKIVEV